MTFLLETMKTGRNIFWAGFIIALGVLIGYLLAIVIGIGIFADCIISVALCCAILLGSLLMLWGKAIERRNGG